MCGDAMCLSARLLKPALSGDETKGVREALREGGGIIIMVSYLELDHRHES